MYQKKDVFLITGGTSGIGAGGALELNAKGATVISVGRDRAKMDQLKTIHQKKFQISQMPFERYELQMQAHSFYRGVV